MKIIGNKSIYFEINDSCHLKNLVPLRISINNNYLGTLESSTYLPSFIYWGGITLAHSQAMSFVIPKSFLAF